MSYFGFLCKTTVAWCAELDAVVAVRCCCCSVMQYLLMEQVVPRLLDLAGRLAVQGPALTEQRE